MTVSCRSAELLVDHILNEGFLLFTTIIDRQSVLIVGNRMHVFCSFHVRCHGCKWVLYAL